MRIPLGGKLRDRSMYSGVRAGPAPKAWTPDVHEVPDAPEVVPQRLRRVRLHRTRRSRMAPTPTYVLIPIVLALAGFLCVLVFRVLGS